MTAVYAGDEKYSSSTNKTSFAVYGTGGELTVKTSDIFAKQNETIEVIFAEGKHEGMSLS